MSENKPKSRAVRLEPIGHQGVDLRHRARQVAMQFLYQLDVQKGGSLEQLEDFLKEYGSEEQDRRLAREWINGSWKNIGQIDQLIESFSSNWQLNRISLVDRSNMRLAVYQLLYCPDVPAKVVINEAVELAKEFSTAGAPGFINGILDAIYRSIHSS